jgi:hypothetical protein
VAKLVDLRLVSKVQVLPRAENFNRRHAGLPNLLQPKRR